MLGALLFVMMVWLPSMRIRHAAPLAFSVCCVHEWQWSQRHTVELTSGVQGSAAHDDFDVSAHWCAVSIESNCRRDECPVMYVHLVRTHKLCIMCKEKKEKKACWPLRKRFNRRENPNQKGCNAEYQFKC